MDVLLLDPRHLLDQPAKLRFRHEPTHGPQARRDSLDELVKRRVRIVVRVGHARTDGKIVAVSLWGDRQQ